MHNNFYTCDAATGTASTANSYWHSPSNSTDSTWSDGHVQLGTATTDLYKSYVRLCKSYVRISETASQWMSQAVYVFTEWTKYAMEKPPYTPDRFICMPKQDVPNDDAQRLAPIDEALEHEGLKPVINHLERLLNDEAYRNQQLTEINKVNKKLNLGEAVFNAEAVQKKLKEIKDAFSPVNVWKHKAARWMEKRAEENAEHLFNEVFTPEEVMKLKIDKKLLISRNGLSFELLAKGEINQLLPNGEKQGWCLISKEAGFLLHDILVMKKLLLENAPEIVLQTAHKRSPFN